MKIFKNLSFVVLIAIVFTGCASNPPASWNGSYYPDQSLKGQAKLFGSGITAFLLPYSKAGQERGVIIPSTFYTAPVNGRTRLPSFVRAGVNHARTVDPLYELKQNLPVGTVIETTRGAGVFVFGEGDYWSGATWP